MDYVRFGTGSRVLIMLPGLGDGLRSTKGLALPMALLYRQYSKAFTVYLFSRKNDMPEGCTTRDMARHLIQAMDALGISRADVFGVSMGGMIAQHLAADYPDRVGKLVLAVTCPRPNPVLEAAVAEWMEAALADDHTALMESNLRLIYSENYYRRNKWMVPILGKTTKPKCYSKFLVMASACRSHDAWDRLSAIASPTLVLGGEADRCVGAEASRELTDRISGAELWMYPRGGHSVYEEERDFHKKILEFLKK